MAAFGSARGGVYKHRYTFYRTTVLHFLRQLRAVRAELLCTSPTMRTLLSARYAYVNACAYVYVWLCDTTNLCRTYIYRVSRRTLRTALVFLYGLACEQVRLRNVTVKQRYVGAYMRAYVSRNESFYLERFFVDRLKSSDTLLSHEFITRFIALRPSRESNNFNNIIIATFFLDSPNLYFLWFLSRAVILIDLYHRTYCIN